MHYKFITVFLDHFVIVNQNFTFFQVGDPVPKNLHMKKSIYYERIQTKLFYIIHNNIIYCLILFMVSDSKQSDKYMYMFYNDFIIYLYFCLCTRNIV